MGQARDLMNQWWSFFEAGDIEAAGRLSQPDVEVTLPGGMRLHGPAESMAVLGGFREAFPDLRHEMHVAVEDEQRVAVELTVIGTHTGTFHTPAGDIPPTGRAVVWESVDVVTVRDGKIASWHTYFDQLAFLAQLGLLPEVATA